MTRTIKIRLPPRSTMTDERTDKSKPGVVRLRAGKAVEGKFAPPYFAIIDGNQGGQHGRI